MRKLRLFPVLVAAFLLGLPAAAGAASLSAAFGGGDVFPDRSLVVTIPAASGLTSSRLQLQENAHSVTAATVTPLGAAGANDFGVVLAIDTSPPGGQPLDEAFAAARTLIAQRTGNQQMGIVEFDRTARVTVPISSDGQLIAQEVAVTPTATPGLHLYDGVSLAIEQLAQHRIAAGAVIVLSDGKDGGSQASLAGIARSAAAAHVKIYAVDCCLIRSRIQALRALAAAGNGTYIKATFAGLSHTLTAIESQLTARYLIRYRSDQPFRRLVHVTLSVDGIAGSWTGSYLSPPPPLSSREPLPITPARHTSFWASSLTFLVVAVLSAVLLAFAALIHLMPRFREDLLRRRIRQFTLTHADAPVPEADASLRESRLETWLQRFSWWPRFVEDVDVARIERSPIGVVGVAAAVTTMAALLLAVPLRVPALGLLAYPLSPFITSAIIGHLADRQRRTFSDELPGHLEEVSAAMRGGYSIVASLTSMAKDATEPTKEEFERALADERLGVPLDAALHPISRRMKCSDIEQLALVAALHQKTGGNMAEVLDLIAAGARERAELRRELRALTAQARMSRWILTGLPVALLLLLTLIRPGYVQPLFHTTGGLIALAIATTLVVTGSLVMRMLVPNEV